MKTKKIQFTILACILLSFFFITNSQSASEIKVTGIFSSMYQNPETEDIVGMEIFILKTRNQYYAILQMAEGEPYKPVIVEVKITGNNIEFKTPGPPEDYIPQDVFKGKISQTGISGKWEKAGYESFLKRGKSFWQ